jgi:hypothetical protein
MVQNEEDAEYYLNTDPAHEAFKVSVTEPLVMMGGSAIIPMALSTVGAMNVMADFSPNLEDSD